MLQILQIQIIGIGLIREVIHSILIRMLLRLSVCHRTLYADILKFILEKNIKGQEIKLWFLNLMYMVQNNIKLSVTL